MVLKRDNLQRYYSNFVKIDGEIIWEPHDCVLSKAVL